MASELSTRIGIKSEIPTGRPWKFKKYVVISMYFICCACLIGFSVDLRSLEYFLGMLLGIGLVFFLTQLVAVRLRVSSTSDEMERNKEISMLVAAGAGILANTTLQTLALRYDHLIIPRGAFISLYCALLLLGSPMPFFPGDELFYRASRRERSIMFLAVVAASIWRIGMLIPALFIYVDRDCFPTDNFNDGEQKNRCGGFYGAVTAGLSTIAAIGVVFASR